MQLDTCVCWTRRTKALIAGDMVAGEGTILLEPTEGDLGDYLNSLSNSFSSHHDVYFRARSHPLSRSPALRQYIQHRLMRTQQIVHGLNTFDNPTTVMDLVPLIYPQLQTEAHPLAALQITCHLQWFLRQHAIVSTDDEYRYSLIDEPQRLDAVIHELDGTHDSLRFDFS